ncbi:hypothetical protein, partial [Pseudomonas saxonica]|uniref:hypothetical protein n=1 Tax=Pseudomonas saxonica TaxID=2600598 RepID=UPI001F1A8C4A
MVGQGLFAYFCGGPTLGCLTKVSRRKGQPFQGLGLISLNTSSQDEETMWDAVLDRFEKKTPASVMTKL